MVAWRVKRIIVVNTRLVARTNSGEREGTHARALVDDKIGFFCFFLFEKATKSDEKEKRRRRRHQKKRASKRRFFFSSSVLCLFFF